MESIEPKFEKKSSVERIVGGTKEEKEEARKILEQRFEEQELREIKGVELEKTPEEVKIIDLVNEETNNLLAKYNLPEFNIQSKNVHILDKEDFKKTRKDPERVDAYHSPYLQAILMSKSDSKIALARRAYHEFLHFKSYQAFQKIKEGGVFDLYRYGLTMYSRDGKMSYFKNLNEATIEELSKRFYFQRLKDDPFFKKETEELEKIRKNILSRAKTEQERKEAMDIAEVRPLRKGEIKRKSIKEFFSWRNLRVIHGFEYPQQRIILDNLIDKLYQKNQDKFKDREEVFDVFAKSMLSGNLLPVGKLVDRTLGKGVFRKIGELDKDIEKQKEFVEKL